jgi:hypothetical protein
VRMMDLSLIELTGAQSCVITLSGGMRFKTF